MQMLWLHGHAHLQAVTPMTPKHTAARSHLHTLQVRIDNESSPLHTVLTIDSANRPGTLVEVVQCLTELGLSVVRARISSDGGWFVDGKWVAGCAGGGRRRTLPRARARWWMRQLPPCAAAVTPHTPEFHVSEVPRGRVTDPKKLDVIRRVLSVPEHTGVRAVLWHAARRLRCWTAPGAGIRKHPPRPLCAAAIPSVRVCVCVCACRPAAADQHGLPDCWP
jgi:hypothetical protein